MLNFLRKHIKTTGFVIGALTLGVALLAGATPFLAILVALTLTFFSVMVLKKTEKSEPASDLPLHHDQRSYVPSTMPPVRPLPNPTPPQPPLGTQITQVENQATQTLEEMNRGTQEVQAQREAKRRAAQQKIEEMREKYAAQQKDAENKKEETIRKKQEEHRKKIDQCPPEGRQALIQSCNEEIAKITATLDRLLKTKKESDDKALLALKTMHDAEERESVASSMATVRKYNGLPSPGIAGVLSPELNQHNRKLQTNLEHQQAKLKSEQTETNRRLQNLAMQSEQNKNNTIQVINKHENKMAEDHAAHQAKIRQEMENTIKAEKEEYQKKLEALSDKPEAQAALTKEHEQKIMAITQDCEDTLSAFQKGYDSSVSLMNKIRSNGGL